MKRARKIVLASRSPARFKILREADISITRAFPDINESRHRGENIRHLALRLAEDKAKKIAERKRDAIIIAVDTVISYRDHIFGKPRNKREAKRFLKALSGKTHRVYSGTVVMDAQSGKIIKKLVVTKVKFAKLSREIIEWYISTGEPFRAAGAYSIQNKGRALVESVDGCFTNVIGVSVPLVLKILRELRAI